MGQLFISSVYSAASVVVNSINSRSGYILVISVNAVTKDSKRPMFNVVYKMDHKAVGAYTRKNVEAVLNKSLPRIMNDFKSSPHIFLTRDGNSINCSSWGVFTKFKGLINMYCLPHMIIRQILSILNGNSETHEFRSASGIRIKVETLLRPTKRDCLTTEKMTERRVTNVLIQMASLNEDDHQWKDLQSKKGDTSDMRLTKTVIRHLAELYRCSMVSTAAEARETIRKCLEDLNSFVFFSLATRSVKSCWGPMARDTLEMLMKCHDELPLMMFTTCCDELLGANAAKYVHGGLQPGVTIQEISYSSITQTFEILCNHEPQHVHNLYGSYTSRLVKFVNNVQ